MPADVTLREATATDSKYLHCANPSGFKRDKPPRSGDVLREELREFGEEARRVHQVESFHVDHCIDPEKSLSNLGQ